MPWSLTRTRTGRASLEFLCPVLVFTLKTFLLQNIFSFGKIPSFYSFLHTRISVMQYIITPAALCSYVNAIEHCAKFSNPISFFLDSALQIFQKESHPSAYKGGSGAKEGLSLFGKKSFGPWRCSTCVNRPSPHTLYQQQEGRNYSSVSTPGKNQFKHLRAYVFPLSVLASIITSSFNRHDEYDQVSYWQSSIEVRLPLISALVSNRTSIKHHPLMVSSASIQDSYPFYPGCGFVNQLLIYKS